MHSCDIFDSTENIFLKITGFYSSIFVKVFMHAISLKRIFMKYNVLRGEGARNFDIFIHTPNSSKYSKNCCLFEYI